MSGPLRDVRPTRGFYADLHRRLPAERGRTAPRPGSTSVVELISLGIDLRPLPGPDDHDQTD